MLSENVLGQGNSLYKVPTRNASDLQSGAFYANDEFLDFIYEGRRASELNIKRTSNGDRYNANLTPEMTDIAVDIPNGDGQYYYGTNYQTRKIVIPFAFDGLTETNLREIKQWLNNTKISKLVLSETPYKFYHAKVTDTCQIKHLCFEVNGERIYRGEGEITFTCFYPFCQGIYYTLRSANTIAEVSASNDTKANIVTSDSTLSDKLEATTAETSVDNLNTIIEYSDPIVTWEEGNTTTLTVFNEGDLPMPFIIFLESFVEDGDGDENTVENTILTMFEIKNEEGAQTETEVQKMIINGAGYVSLKIDNREQWVLGKKAAINYYTLANQALEEGSFFQIEPKKTYKITVSNAAVQQLEFCFLYK